MTPLKITAMLSTGQVAGNDISFPFDSLLAAAWMMRNHPERFYSGSVFSPDEMIEVDLSDIIDRRGFGDLWYWAASFQQRKPLSESIRHWHKRFDDEHSDFVDFGKRRGAVNIKAGQYKAYRMPLRVYLFDRLVWYACGDAYAVEGLISEITHIGKKASQGFGGVESWCVEEYPEDWSVFGEGNRLMRCIPIQEAEGVDGKRGRRGIRPPYWFIRNQTDVISPR